MSATTAKINAKDAARLLANQMLALHEGRDFNINNRTKSLISNYADPKIFARYGWWGSAVQTTGKKAAGRRGAGVQAKGVGGRKAKARTMGKKKRVGRPRKSVNATASPQIEASA